MHSGSEAGSCQSVRTRRKDDEDRADSSDEKPASVFSCQSDTEDGTAAANTVDAAGTTRVNSRCVGDLLDPIPGKCTSKITNDDRHYVSNFFGRNKACSTGIPDEYYQILCRKCMQSMKYRLRSSRGATEIQVQVAAIKHALRNMAADGRWLFVEVQLTKSEFDRRQNPKKYEEDVRKHNEEVIKVREEARANGEAVRRRNVKKPLTPVPDWLAELVQRSDHNPNQDYTTVHERNPTRWTFNDMIALVDMMGGNCEVLPNIECLPVTQGEFDLASLKLAKEYQKEAKDRFQTLADHVTVTEKELKHDPVNQRLQLDLQAFQQNRKDVEWHVIESEADVKRLAEVYNKSAHTMPPKRESQKKSGKDKAKTIHDQAFSSKRKKVGHDQVSSRENKVSHLESEKRRGNFDTSTLNIDTDEKGLSNTTTPSSGAETECVQPPTPTPPAGWKGKDKDKAIAKSGVLSVRPAINSQGRDSSKSSPHPSTPPPRPQPNPTTPRKQSTTPSTPPTSTTRSASRRLERANAAALAAAENESTYRSTKRDVTAAVQSSRPQKAVKRRHSETQIERSDA